MQKKHPAAADQKSPRILAQASLRCCRRLLASGRKIGAVAKIDQTRMGRTADLGNATSGGRVRIGGKMLRRCFVPPLACKEASMARMNLRIYRGPAEKTAPVCAASSPAATVTVNLGEVLPLLADAVASRRTWLSDFEDDPITISADLYEVLLAYQYFRHPAA
jgi:hypothetical protein